MIPQFSDTPVFVVGPDVAAGDAVAGLCQFGVGRLGAHDAGDGDRGEEPFDLDRILGGHMDNLVQGWWRHMDAGADIGHQQELTNPCPLVFERDHIARQAHALAVERRDHRRHLALISHQAFNDLQDRRDPRVVKSTASFGDELVPGEVQRFRRRRRPARHNQPDNRGDYQTVCTQGV